LPPAAGVSRLAAHLQIHPGTTLTTLILAGAGLLVVIAAAWLREASMRRKPRMLGEILDLADALERELLECRRRLREIPALTASLTPSAQISARATLAAEPQVQDALRDLLAHRLWLKSHAADASLAELATARDALLATRSALAASLERLADVRADVDQRRGTAAPALQAAAMRRP
jgi:hypothetical protein